MLLFKITVKVVYSFCSRYYKIQLRLLAHHELENKIECTVKCISYNSLWVAVNNYKSAWNISFKNIQVSTYPMLSAYLKAIKKAITWTKIYTVILSGNQTPPLLDLNNDFLTSTDTYKHLGVTVSHDYKWHTDIKNMLLSASRLLGIVRKLRYSVGRKTMNNICIYITYQTYLVTKYVLWT